MQENRKDDSSETPDNLLCALTLLSVFLSLGKINSVRSKKRENEAACPSSHSLHRFRFRHSGRTDPGFRVAPTSKRWDLPVANTGALCGIGFRSFPC